MRDREYFDHRPTDESVRGAETTGCFHSSFLCRTSRLNPDFLIGRLWPPIREPGTFTIRGTFGDLLPIPSSAQRRLGPTRALIAFESAQRAAPLGRWRTGRRRRPRTPKTRS